MIVVNFNTIRRFVQNVPDLFVKIRRHTIQSAVELPLLIDRSVRIGIARQYIVQ